MNVRRLLLIANTITSELERAQVIQTLDQLIQAVNNQINSPGDGNLQQITTHLSQLESAAVGSSLKQLPATWGTVLAELDIEGYLGGPLVERVRVA